RDDQIWTDQHPARATLIVARMHVAVGITLWRYAQQSQGLAGTRGEVRCVDRRSGFLEDEQGVLPSTEQRPQRPALSRDGDPGIARGYRRRCAWRGAAELTAQRAGRRDR